MDDLAERRLHALRDALSHLDGAQMAVPATLAQRAAAGALVRARSLLRAVIVLIETPGVSVTEADVLVRVLLEMAITTAWIGSDEERAAQYRDSGVAEARSWLRGLERLAASRGSGLNPGLRAGLEAYIAEGGDRQMPSLADRARKTAPAREPKQGWISLDDEYDYIYRRLCAAVHHDHRLQALVEPLLGDRAVTATLYSAVVAMGVLLSAAGEALGMGNTSVRGMNLVFNNA